MPPFIATCADATVIRLWPRHPGQSASRLGSLPIAFLPTLPAAIVYRLAADFRCLLCQARPGHGGDVGDRGSHADPDGISRRPLRRPAVPDQRHLADDLVDGGNGLYHRLLADRHAGAAVGCRQLGLSSGGLRDFERLDRSRPARSLLRFHTFTGNIGFAAAPPGNRGADVAFRLARCPDLCRSSRSASGGDDRVAKPHPDRSSAPPVEPRGGRRGRAFVKPLGADVLHVLYGLIDGRRRHSILADHHPAPSARYHACSRLLGADRVLGRPDRRRAARRLGGRPHHPSPYRLSWF